MNSRVACLAISAPVKNIVTQWLLLIILLLGAILVLSGSVPPPVARAEGPTSLTGRLLDPQAQPVRGAEVIVREGYGGTPIAKAESQHDGTFVLDLPSRQFSPQLSIEIARAHFQPRKEELSQEEIAHLNTGGSLRLSNLTLDRRITPGC